MRHFLLSFALVAANTFLFAGSCGVASAQTPPGGSPLPPLADFGDPGDQFGAEVASDGAWAVISGSSGEAYYVYERVGGNWLRRQRIVPPTLGQTGPVSIELRGDRLVFSRAFGIPGDTSGRVYVYERASVGAPFLLTATVVPNDPQAGDRFGYGIALSANRLFVGASGRDEGANVDQGVVYVFQRLPGGWAQEARLAQTDPTVADRFGFGLDFDGQDLLIGARQNRPTATARGAVYVFRLIGNAWTQVQKLVQPGTPGASQFGYDLSAQAGRAAIVAGGSSNSGVFVAERDGTGVWNLLPELPDPIAGLSGLSAGLYSYPDLDGDTLAVSATTGIVGSALTGPVHTVTYHYDGSNWQRVAQIPRSEASSALAASNRISDGWLLVGAPDDDAGPKATHQGSVSAYVLVNGAPTLRQRIWHGSGDVPDYLGENVALDDSWALVTARGANLPGIGGRDLGEVWFMHKQLGVWNFAQAAGASTALGTPIAIDLLGDLAYIAYPDDVEPGQPTPSVRVMQRQPDDRWIFLCDLTFDTAGAPSRLGASIAASASGVLVTLSVDGGPTQILAYPVPSSGACPTGNLLAPPPGSDPSYIVGSLRSAGTLAIAGWSSLINGKIRSGEEIFEFSAGSWTSIQSLVGTQSMGNLSEGYLRGSIDATRMSVIHDVPVSTIDRRADVELYQRVGGIFILQRTLAAPTATGGFDDTLVVGDSVFVRDPSIGANSGIAVFDFASGARLQNIVPPGLVVEDGTASALRISGTDGILGYAKRNRDGVNHTGMVYSLAYSAGAPAAWSTAPMDNTPRTDRMFADFFEDP